jgi:hypothetical protein
VESVKQTKKAMVTRESFGGSGDGRDRCEGSNRSKVVKGIEDKNVAIGRERRFHSM